MTKELLHKFINGLCSKEEQEYVYDWISDINNKEEAAAILKISWDKMSDQMPEGVRGKRSFIVNVLERNNDHELIRELKYTTPVMKAAKTERSGNMWTVLKVAASIIFALGLGLIANQYINEPEELEEVVFIEKSNPNGRKSTIMLPDGSKVKLNSGSTIRYAKVFREDYREVILEGEAFFEIEKDRTRPFIVQTGDISTTVLGTSFNVSAYAKSDEIAVAVVTGKVEVRKAAYDDNEEESMVYLMPNEMATYQHRDRKLSASSFNMEEIVGWKDGVLIFKNADQREIAVKLKRWYGLDVEVDNEILSKRYTGKFDNNSLEYVLKAISYTSDISFEIADNKVVLKQK